MIRLIGAAMLITLMTGCVQQAPEFPSFLRVELPPHEKHDRDIVETSLRNEPETIIAKLPKFITKPDLALRMKSTYARLQFQLPLLPRGKTMRMTAIARSYWEPDEIGSPRGKFLLRLSLPLWPALDWHTPSSVLTDRGHTAAGASWAMVSENERETAARDVHAGDMGPAGDDRWIEGLLNNLDLPVPTGNRS